MLKLVDLFENFDLAKYCLKNYDHDTKSLDKMLEYFRISSNAVYPFSYHGQIRFLRLTPVSERSVSEVEATVNIIEFLRNQGYPAMEPVKMKSGKLVDTVKTQWGTFIMTAFKNVDGEALEDQEVSLDVVTEYGASLGMLHKYLEDCPYKESKMDHMEFMASIRKKLADYHAPDAIMYELRMVERELETIPVVAGHYGLIHYDFQPDNVFYDAEAESFGVIDFDDMIQCFHSLDIVRAIDELDHIVSKKDSRGVSDAFMKGYRMYMPFSEEDEKLFPLMYRIVRLNEYADILRSIQNTVQNEPDWMSELREKLQRKLRIIERNVKAESHLA